MIDQELRDRKTSGKSNSSNEIRMGDWASRATLDIIGLAGMDHDFQSLQDPGNELNQKYRSIIREQPLSSKILFLIGMLTSTSSTLLKVPTQNNREINNASAFIRGVARQMVQEKQKKLDAKKGSATADSKDGKEEDVDIVSVALRSGTFTEENMVDQMMTFLGAGHETTAASLQWAIYYLARNQDVQSRLRDEVRTNLPPTSFSEKASTTSFSSSNISAAAIDSLPYLNAVCNEIFRFRPPVRSTIRISVRDTMIAGVPIPKDTVIILAPEVINHEKELWGPDADVFNPERWMGPGRANTGGAVSNYAMLTFLHGPRSCIGQGFTKSELACLIATVVGRFHIEANDPPSKAPQMDTGITVKPKDGALAKFTPIEGW